MSLGVSGNATGYRVSVCSMGNFYSGVVDESEFVWYSKVT